MKPKFEGSEEFAQEWHKYLALVIPTQEVILWPAIRDSIALLSPSSVCDLGCGDAILTEKLSFFELSSIIGLDINNTLLDAAKLRNISNTKFYCCDLGEEFFPVQKESVDLVFSNNLLMHLDENALNHAISEAYRILRFSGHALFFVTHLEWASLHYELHSLSSNVFFTKRKVWDYHVIEFYRSIANYIEVFKRHKFEKIECIELTIPNDARLSERYLSKAGQPLFAMFKLAKTHE